MRRSLVATSVALAVGGSLVIAGPASATSIPLGAANDTSTASLNGLLNNSYTGLEDADYALNSVGDAAVPCTPTATPGDCTGFPPETGAGALTAAQAQQIAADFTGSTINGTSPDAHTPAWSTEAQGADANYSTDAPKVAAAGTNWANLNSLIAVDGADLMDFPGGLYTVDGDVSISSTATVTAVGKPVAYTATFGVSGAAATGFVLPAAFSLTFPADFTINTAPVADEITAAQEASPPASAAIGTATVTSPEIAALVPGSKGIDSSAQIFAVATQNLTQPEFEIYLGQGDYVLGTITGVAFPLTVTFGEPIVGGQTTPLPVSSVTLNFPAATSPLQATSCTNAGTLTGAMTDTLSTLASTYFGDSADGGSLAMSATPTTVTNNCVATTAKPKSRNKVVTSAAGLTSGHPTFRFEITTRKVFKTITVSLPKGLGFVKSTKLRKEVTGAKIKSVRVVQGKLVIGLKKAVKSETIKTRTGLVKESKALIKSIRRRRTKKLSVHVKAGSPNIKSTFGA